MRSIKTTFRKCSLTISQDHDLKVRFNLSKSRRMPKALLLRIRAIQLENSHTYPSLRAEIVKHLDKNRTKAAWSLTRFNLTPPTEVSVNAGMFELGVNSWTVPSDLTAHNLNVVFKECLAVLEDVVTLLEQGRLKATPHGFMPA